MYPPPDDYDAELAELEWFYARRRRRQRIWAVLAVVVAVSMLMLYILADFFRARGRRSPSTTIPTVQVLEVADYTASTVVMAQARL